MQEIYVCPKKITLIKTQSPRMQYSKLHKTLITINKMHIKLAAADNNGQVNIKIGAVRQALLIYTRHQYIILGGYHHYFYYYCCSLRGCYIHICTSTIQSSIILLPSTIITTTTTSRLDQGSILR